MYDHARKAGNRADVWKHFWLCELVSRLTPDRSGRVSILDTHCGAGLFYRDEAELWDDGIGRFRETDTSILGIFGRTAFPYLARNEYPGSWLLAASVLANRQIEFAIDGCDVSADVEKAFQFNASRFGFSEMCRFTHSDGYALAEQAAPRSLVFFDPPYSPDADRDWQALGRVIPAAASSAEVVALWYPLSASDESRHLSAMGDLTGYEIAWGDLAQPGTPMKGCGLGLFSDTNIDLTRVEQSANAVAERLGGEYTKRVARS